MSNQKANKEELLTIEDELDYVRKKLLDIDPNSTPELINELQERLLEISKNNKRKNIFLKWLLYFFSALVIGVVVLSVNEFQNNSYKAELEQRLNEQIKDSNKQDSLFNKYLGVDSTGSYTTTSENGKLLSYKDLVQAKYKLEENNRKLRMKFDQNERKFEKLKEDYDFITMTYEVNVTKSVKGSTTYTTITSKKLDDCYGIKTKASKSTTIIRKSDSIK